MQQLAEFIGNHPLLVGAFCAILTLLIINLVRAGTSGALSPHEAVQLLNRQDAIVVDVREAADFENGHIREAINVPLKAIKAGETKRIKAKGKPILVCCASGSTAVQAAKELTRLEFEQVQALRGGIAAWSSENLPLTQGK